MNSWHKLLPNIIRGAIVVLVFLPFFQVHGLDLRTTQEVIFKLSAMLIFCLILDNIWLSLFMILTVFSFCIFKFQIGYGYVQNVFFGMVIYYVVRKFFKKEHINLLINSVLWLCFFNIALMSLQLLKFDFIFYLNLNGVAVDNWDPCGFMGYKAMIGVLMAICVPLLLSREGWWAKIAALGLFVPLYISSSTTAIFAAIVGALFVIWYILPDMLFKIKKSHLFIAILLILLLLGTSYTLLIDAPMGMMNNRLDLWKLVLRDAMLRPLAGWGLDSLRNITPWKQHAYILNDCIVRTLRVGETIKKHQVDVWDNAHNLYVQLFFEWGILAIIILIGLIRQYVLWFKNAMKSSNTIALMATLFVLLVLNIGQFPLFLARGACFIIPLCAVLERQIRGSDE